VWVRPPPLAPPMLVTMKQEKKVHFVSLGCPKNRVDSEVMLGHLSQEGYSSTPNPSEAQLIVINTCGFIDAAKEESINTILEMGAYKTTGQCQTLVVAGCLSQRYAPDLAKEIPEVDHFLGTGNFESITQVIAGQAASNTSPKDHPRLHGRNKLVPFKHDGVNENSIVIPDPDFTLTAHSPRVATLPSYTAYLKISEGCSNTCAFCIIPKLRGPQRSRSIEDILEEAQRLISSGVVEITLIAQDLCAYGKDLQPRVSLAQLLQSLEALGAAQQRPIWFRCMYAYPTGLTREVMETIAQAKTIVPYIDLPLQHISDNMLRHMRRGKGGPATRALVKELRQTIPQLVFRTTFITGMPGETEDDFLELKDFIQESRFERMGVFPYSQEEDTPAGAMENQVDPALAQERCNTLMEIQKAISREQQQNMVGQEIDVLVEGLSEESDLLLQGRHKGQAPEIDGLTYITSGTANPGDVVRILVDQAGDYDVAGEMVFNHSKERTK
jgi:ribosomal protein S12 methylthiotransferase